MYLREADCYLVAASFGGHDQDPAWLTNVQASPRAVITVEGRDVPVVAMIAAPEERERLWPRFLSLSAGRQGWGRPFSLQALRKVLRVAFIKP